jgi:hypothetical protein
MGLDMERYWSATDDERRQMVKDIAGQHYKKGKTENYQRLMDRQALWRDVDIIVNREAENVAVEPKLQRAERLAGETNTRPELRRTREALTVIPREKLSEPRVQRYDRVETRLGEIEKVITELEPEIGALRRQPFVTTQEARERDVNALLRVAREQGISRAGGQTIAESNVRYRTGASPRTFEVKSYPIGRYDSDSGTWSEGPVFRVYDDEGKLLGTFDHRPNASEIKEKWRS